MSTRLQLLPNLRSSSPVSKPIIAAGKENSIFNTNPNNKRNEELQFISDENCCHLKIGNEASNSKGQVFLTPKSAKSRIPKPQTCPPAPRKPARRAVLSCKRKLMPEFDFFEADRREEVDEFLRSSFERIPSNGQSAKRKSAGLAVAACASTSSSSSSTSPSSPAGKV